MAGERPCGLPHDSIGDAIRHAEASLRFPQRWRLHDERLNVGAEYCFGTMSHNAGAVIGRQMGPRLRWRLDFDPAKGAHVNEEDSHTGRKCLHPIPDLPSSLVYLIWRKWTSQTSATDQPVQAAAYEYLRQRRRDPRISLDDICRRLQPHGTPNPPQFVARVQAYIAKYDYLPRLFA